jgi:hypothetical protein
MMGCRPARALDLPSNYEVIHQQLPRNGPIVRDTDLRRRNREAQARWRERHIGRRRTVQRIANILQRRRWDDEHFETLGDLLRSLMNREALRSLRRALRDQKYADEEMDAIWREREKNTRAWWLSEHPGRTAAEYNRLLRDQDSEVWDWRRSKGAAEIAAEREAWERDHPGKQYPEHLCGLSDREYSDYERWRRKQERKSRRT